MDPPTHTHRKQAIVDFLRSFGMPSISEETILQRRQSSIPLASMPSGKAPGPDGLPASYYKTLDKDLLPHFLTFNSVDTAHGLGTETLKAHITLIP